MAETIYKKAVIDTNGCVRVYNSVGSLVRMFRDYDQIKVEGLVVTIETKQGATAIRAAEVIEERSIYP